jgi:hypothetical protein
MMKHLRGWGFPVGLLMVWALAVAYTLYALRGMGSAVQSEQSTVQSVQAPVMAADPVATEEPNPAHAS